LQLFGGESCGKNQFATFARNCAYMATNIILNQLFILGVLALVGAMATKARILTNETKDTLARIIIDVTLPFLIFSTFSRLEFDIRLIGNGLVVSALALVNLGFLFLLGSLSSHILHLNRQQGTIHTLHTMFGNIVFLGFPLFDALFPGGIGVFYAALYQLASNTVTFTYGIYRLSSGAQKSGLKSLLNVNTGALLLGIVVMVSRIQLPKPLMDAFSGLGKCTSPLSMVYIGALLDGMNFKNPIKTGSVYLLALNKLVIAPLVLGFSIMFLLKSLGIEIAREAFFVLVMQAGMPCQTIVVVMTRRYGGDYQLATSNLFITTIMSVLTLPFVYLFLNGIWG